MQYIAYENAMNLNSKGIVSPVLSVWLNFWQT